MLERIDRYEIRERIGAGGQATVYLGHDTLLGRTVAVKVMNQLVSAQREYVEALMSEAQLAAGLSHPNIATVFDFKIDGDYACIVMEYVTNSLNKELLDTGAMSPGRVVELTLSICDALAYYDPNWDSYLHAYTDIDFYHDTNSDDYPDPDDNTHRHTRTVSHPDYHAHADTYCDANAYLHTYPNTDRDANASSYLHPYFNTNAYTNFTIPC